MLGHKFFGSRAWSNVINRFARERNAQPAVEFHCTNGSSFKAAGLSVFISCLAVEAYGQPGENTVLRLVPYEHIDYVELRDGSEDVRFNTGKPLGFRVQKR